MYDVRIYKNTGLNAVNILDSPDLLNDPSQFVYDSVPALDILQNIFLSVIRIKSTWQNVKDVDYCRIGNNVDGYFYYFVDGVRMTSVDVAELSLLPDFITSAGGINNVEILDGIITRCHVSEDNYGEWNIEDEFLTPSEPLQIDTEIVEMGKLTNVFVESTLDLGAMACIGSSDAYIDSEGESVQVPATFTGLLETGYTMNGQTGTTTATTLYYYGDIIKEGINRCRGLGVENAIRCQVAIPSTLVIPTLANEFARGNEAGVTIYKVEEGGQLNPNSYTIAGAKFIHKSDNNTAQWSVVEEMTAPYVDKETTISYEYQQVNNKRVLYGSLNKVGILTTAGNRLESNPEDTKNNDVNITIRALADPHPTGCAYYRFRTMNGNSSFDAFFINAIKGLPWKQIPLVYSEASGNVLNKIDFQNSRELADLNYYTNPTGLTTGLLQSYGMSRDTADEIAGGLTALTAGGGGAIIGGAKAGIGGAIAGGVAGATSAGLNAIRTIQGYNTARKQEMQQFAIQQRVVSPEISITYDGEAFRDFYGENVIVYRYRPTASDIRRLDNILTMYGYKVNIAGKDAPTDNRQYFNYLMGNITVGGNLPKWMCDGITLQIANGVRIWHVKPSSNYYESNPIK